MLERDILKQCLAVLKYRGIFAFRQNCGAVKATYKGKKRFVRFGIRGASDILGILPGGRFLAVETKRPGNRPTKAQTSFLQAVERAGGVGLVVYSADELERDLEELGL